MKKIAIVGGGIAGLAAGVYAQNCGFDTTIYESHTMPGGACTSWKRKGYIFEGAMHWLTGSSPKSSYHQLWRDVGAINDQVQFHSVDPFLTVECEGQIVCLYRNLARWQQHLISIAPEDDKEIKRLCSDLSDFSKFSMPIKDLKGLKLRKPIVFEKFNLLKFVALLPAIIRIGYYAKISSKDYARRFKNPAIRLLLRSITGDEYAATATVFTLATLMNGDGAFPDGGSLAMAARMAAKYQSLGGVIEYKHKVAKIVVKEGRAVGLEVNDRQVDADAVIITQDAAVATQDLFEKPLSDRWVLQMRNTLVPKSCTFLCVGTKADLCNEPKSGVFIAGTPLKLGDCQFNIINYHLYSAESGYAPGKGTAITSIIGGDSYDFWKNRELAGTYKQTKEQLAQDFIAVLTQHFPHLKGQIEVWDVATPLTYERYIHSYKGSWMGISTVGSKMGMYPCKVRSIENVYFAGQRISPPGGLPSAVNTARTAVQHLCRDFDVAFG
ncbi:MAG: NAD(P)/FAD-dependent oxidoreductase [Spirochaetes bacterium]|nr:NAD(P)/FAD-dependent oxidoreductase [Spirochaetota bacterium]MBU0955158.1 NAD(P)/FAD-dependent oxidoreductase [Spirochaetota bacterium]